MKKGILCILLVTLLLPCFSGIIAFAGSASAHTVKEELVENYWGTTSEVYEFWVDGSGYIWKPESMFDVKKLRETLENDKKSMKKTSFQYEIYANQVYIYREDREEPLVLCYLSDTEVMDMDTPMPIMPIGFFYLVTDNQGSYISPYLNNLMIPTGEEYFMGYHDENVHFFPKDDVFTTQSTSNPTVPSISEVEEYAEEEPSLEVDDEKIPETVTPAPEVESMEDAASHDSGIFGKIRAFFDRLAEWFTNFFSSLF